MDELNNARGKYRVTTEAFGIVSTVDVYADNAVEAAFLVGLSSDEVKVNSYTDFTESKNMVTAHSCMSASAERIGDAPEVDTSAIDPIGVILGLI